MDELLRSIYGMRLSTKGMPYFDAEGTVTSGKVFTHIIDGLLSDEKEFCWKGKFFVQVRNPTTPTDIAGRGFAALLAQNDRLPRRYVNGTDAFFESFSNTKCKEIVRELRPTGVLCQTCDMYLRVDLLKLATAYCLDNLSPSALDAAIEGLDIPFHIEFASKQPLAYQMLLSATMSKK